MQDGIKNSRAQYRFVQKNYDNKKEKKMFNHKRLFGIALFFALGALLFSNSTPRVLAQPETDEFAQTTVASPDALPLDHYWCYQTTGDLLNEPVSVQDQFQANPVTATVVAPEIFCNPVRKRHNDKTYNILDSTAHFTAYKMVAPEGVTHQVRVRNQFGRQRLQVAAAPLWLTAPTMVQGQLPPQNLDHFECYRVQGAAVNQTVDLRDEFKQASGLVVGKPVLLCNPTRKIHNGQTYEIKHPEAHLVCYQVTKVRVNRQINTQTQFQQALLTVKNPKLLCAPSQKAIID